MATIYRFIVEGRETANADQTQLDAQGARVPVKGAGTRSYTGSNRGVEHNRYMRAVNPLVNRHTGGWWEKGLRVGRATKGVYLTSKSHGLKSALTGVGAIILLQFAIMEISRAIERARKEADLENRANFLKLQSGQTVLPKDYKLNRSMFGKITYRKQ